MRKLKVLFIADPVEVGGASKSLIDVVSAMNIRGLECVVCTSRHGHLEKQLQKIEVPCIADGHMAAMEVPPVLLWKRPFVYFIRQWKYRIALKKAIHKLKRSIDLGSFDLIHTNSARNDLGCELAKRYSIPHIVHIREFGEKDFGCWNYRFNYVNYLNLHTNKFIAISQAVRNSWISKGIDEKKVSVVYNGVDHTQILTVESESHFDKDVLKMVIVGGICEAKGQLEITKAVTLLPNAIRNKILLDFVGWGDESYISKINAEIDKNRLNSQIQFLGTRDDVPSTLRNYHIGLMCSRAEAFGRVTVKYMHAGLAVIASKAGANDELIETEVTGLLYEQGNSRDLAEKIIMFYKDRNLLKKCAKNGFLSARKKYTKELNADHIYEIYQDVVAGKLRRENGFK